MPKAEKGTPKYLANKMKAKGLQKLRWYCQMCEKQCRDENGFKCHTTSEAHQRQLLLFGENPHRYLDDFSKEFSDGYIELLRRRFGTRRVAANQVYQEYIAHRDHLHMNATKWLSLTGFVQWLGREGKCIVDETEKGWFVTYIDRDPETLARQQALAKKDKMDKDDEERMLEFVEKQVGRAVKDGENSASSSFTELKRENEELKIMLTLRTGSIVRKPLPVKASSGSSVFKVPRDVKDKWETSSSCSSKSTSNLKRKSALEQIREDEERTKARKYQKDYWLATGIAVKIMTRKLGDNYFKQKGVITELVNNYVAIVKLFDNGHKIKMDQEYLETVIPAEGSRVKILNGEFRGAIAMLETIETIKCNVTAVICSGTNTGKILRKLPFEDVSKYMDE